MAYSIIIPARFQSTRLPGKPLLDINGKPLIQHVYECAIKSNAEQVIIATDHKKILELASNFGAKVCMTRSDHPSGTDRLSEVVSQLEIDEGDIVVNLQGDEPMMPSELLDQVANSLENTPSAAISTLSEPILSTQDVFNPDIVKVITDHSGFALYFSRAPVPWIRGQYNYHRPEVNVSIENCFRHIGLYAYRAGFLKEFPALNICHLEQQEALEQLRAMYYGYRIKVEVAYQSAGIGVDTPADLEKARRMLQ